MCAVWKTWNLSFYQINNERRVSTLDLVNTFGFHKMQGISRPAEQVLTFKIWPCSLGLVAWLVTSLDGWLDRWEGRYV